jgi:hypothetical protein
MPMTVNIDYQPENVSVHESMGRAGKIAFPILLFLLSFLPRSLDLVASSTIWHIRARRFIDAIPTREWETTLQAPHPGVTTMWLAGIGRNLGRFFLPNWNDRPLDERMSIELLPLTLIISLAIVLTYFLLTRIFDRQIAVVGSLLLALDPFHIYVSKTLHVDALLAIFMMLSVLLLWIFIIPSGKGRRRYMLFSGIMAGLALLSKTPALFLIPYCLLTLVLWQITEQKLAGRNLKEITLNWRQWGQPLKKIGLAFAVWLVAYATIYWLVWPSMWVQPLETLRLSLSETLRYADSPHPTQILFMGQTISDDPGPIFYPVSLLIRTTAITLPFFLLSIGLLFSHKVNRYQKLVILLAFAFVGFFTLQMTLGEKKFDRYLLATFEFVIILAGVGVVYAARWIAGSRRWLLSLLLLVVVAIQAAIALPRHPYYGTHFNRLLGGPKTVLGKEIVPGQEQGEGLDIAADFLNGLPESESIVAGVLIEEAFGRYFDGLAVPMIDESVDYLVFARNWIVRDTRAYRWEHLWEEYRDQEPVFVVDYDGVPYVWVYKVEGSSEDTAYKISNEINAELDGQIRLLGFDLSPNQLHPGDSVELVLYWEAIEKPQGNYTVFTHLLDSEGLLWGQKDHRPLHGDYPTNVWNSGDIVRDPHSIKVSPEAPPGNFQIEVGMYTLETLERLPIAGSDGFLLPDARIVIPGPLVISASE